MAFIRLIATVLLASSTVWSSHHPFALARNQYQAGSEQYTTQPLLLAEATDHHQQLQEVHFKKKFTEKAIIPDLQIGCADGLIHTTDKKKIPNGSVEKNKIPSRRKRSYTPWSGQVNYVPYQSITVWRPPMYQISRPYFVPIFGVAGRPPIYYPPQPLSLNPGVPKDNQKPFKGPTYLPPSPKEPKMNITDRFNGGDNYDDKPIWDIGNEDTKQTPPITTTMIIPTRRTRPPGAPPPTLPPLIHNPSNGQRKEQSAESAFDDVFPTYPPPPMVTRRPPQKEPSRCVWAIISCCSPTEEPSLNCFDRLGCPGVFWDSNPCNSEYAKAAIAAALNFYNEK